MQQLITAIVAALAVTPLFAHGGHGHALPSDGISTSLSVALLFGIAPIFLGLFCVFLLKHLKERAMNYLLYIALGLMLFLFVSISADQLKNSDTPFWIYPAGFLAGSMVLLIYYSFKEIAFRPPMDAPMRGEFPQKFFLLMPPTRRERATFNIYALSYAIAWGIGLHGMGEGIYLSSLSLNASSMTELLSVSLHKFVEGLGIVVPIAHAEIKTRRLITLGSVAGLPLILGYVVGLVIQEAFLIAMAAGIVFYGIVMLTELAYQTYRSDSNPIFVFLTLCGSFAFFIGLDQLLQR